MTSQYDNDVQARERSRVAAAKDKALEKAGAARERVGHAAQVAGEKTHAAYDTARDRTQAAYDTARDRTQAAYEAARERAGEAYGTAREGVKTAGRKTADGVDANPLAALFGGIALGALIAAVLPRTRREDDLLGNVGKKINSGAKEAADAARVAGTGKLAEYGFTRETAKQKFGELAGNAGEAARTSAQAAAQKLKGGQKA